MIGDPGTFLVKLAQIIWINVLLSGDNAVVIALACRGLPENMRKIGILAGSGAAIGLRVVFTFIIVWLLALPFLKLVSGLLLFWIAIKLVLDEHSHANINSSSNLWNAVRTIAVADAVMSLDNVVAIAAIAKDSMLLIVIGLIISIPMIAFGSTAVLAMIDRFPAIVWLGAGLLGWVAGELLSSDPVWTNWLGSHLHHVIELWAGPAGVAFTLALAFVMTRLKAKAA